MTPDRDLRGRYTTADLRASLQREIEDWRTVKQLASHKMPDRTIGTIVLGPAFAKEFVLKFGRDYTAAPWPRKRRMAEQECYSNTYKLVVSAYGMRRNLTYVEGFAVSAGLLRVGFPEPINHAWAVDAAGTVYDPTFACPEQSVYVGLPVPTELHHTMVLKTRFYGLFYPGEMLNMEFFERYAAEVVPSLATATTDSR